MDRLISVAAEAEIPASYVGTPIGDLLRFHNLGQAGGPFDQARLLIGMCMDHRKHLRIPDNFAYIIRTGGANLRYSEFKVSYAIAVGGVFVRDRRRRGRRDCPRRAYAVRHGQPDGAA